MLRSGVSGHFPGVPWKWLVTPICALGGDTFSVVFRLRLEYQDRTGLAEEMMKPAGKRFAIDAPTALRIIRDDPGIGSRHRLVGPAVLRSHVLSLLYREMREGAIEEKVARAQLDGLATLQIRLLGDRVSRATAWKIAGQLDWEDTALAEYLAVATLQADAFIAADPTLQAAAAEFTSVADYATLRS